MANPKGFSPIRTSLTMESAALDAETGTCYIVTAYEPDPDLWENGFRVRRTP